MLPFLNRDLALSTPAHNTDPTRSRFLGPLLGYPETLAVTLRQALDIPTRNFYRSSIRNGNQPAPDPVLAAHLVFKP